MIRHVRPKWVCRCCEHIAQVPAPSRPIARGLAGPGLLAHVLVSKFVDHLPLYRQSEIYAREGVDLERSTLAGWVGQSSQLLRPLINALERHVMGGHKVHADDTPIGVLAPGHGKTKTAHLWTYVRDDRPAGYTTPAAVWFAYSPDRKGQHPRAHVKGFSGILQADGYAGLLSCMRRAPFRRLRAGFTPAASFTMSTKTWLHRLPPRRCNGLRHSMPSKARFEGNRPTCEKRFGKAGQVRCWNHYTPGLTRR